MSMTLHHTSLCFVCSHLASGEKEGDEVRRNADVAEILKSAHFPRACKSSAAHQRVLPERILEHDKMIWLGDLNYRVSLSYEETRTLLEENDWDALLEKDQLMIEREAGRVFGGWKEGKISFAPTYKYTQNSDAYAGETVKSKKKRRTPEDWLSTPSCSGGLPAPDLAAGDLRAMMVADLMLLGSDATYADRFFRDHVTSKLFTVKIYSNNKSRYDHSPWGHLSKGFGA
uniref:Inositol polyphosphate-related phosphatase domain-containing protein n=1 Tax=Aegilops tauschii subsp. strangulata TaxID=200361 RepID=A0A453R599_AEGTS